MDYIDFMGGFGALGGSGGRIELNSDDVGIPLGQDMNQGFVWRPILLGSTITMI